MSNIARANKLQEAFELLDRAHARVQEALGNTDTVQGAWEQLEDVLKEHYDGLVEMQITD
jgi:hypothetical protein